MNNLKKIILMLLCFALIGQAQAQRFLPGQKGLQLTVGAVDGFNLKEGDKQAFCLGIAHSTYTQGGNRWVFGAEYLEKKHEYRDLLIPVSQITAEGGYYKQVLSDPSKTVAFSVGASAMAGYETINWGKVLLFDGATIQSKDAFLYGGAITFEMETYLTDRLVLLANTKERVLFGSSITKFHTQINVGIKLIIN